VAVDTFHQSPGGHPTQVRLRLHRSDRSGRRWTFHVPPGTKRGSDLVISASFAKGDAFAEIGLRRRDRQS
jgi:hypothetical protein